MKYVGQFISSARPDGVEVYEADSGDCVEFPLIRTVCSNCPFEKGTYCLSKHKWIVSEESCAHREPDVFNMIMKVHRRTFDIRKPIKIAGIAMTSKEHYVNFAWLLAKHFGFTERQFSRYLFEHLLHYLDLKKQDATMLQKWFNNIAGLPTYANLP